MAADVYKLTTLNLFEDLKNTNIKNEDFKQIVSSYQKLASTYIKEKQTDLYKDLNKQKEVIFSYLPSFKQESIKKVASLHKKLEAEMGNLDDIDTLTSPKKEVQFVKIAYNNGKWTIATHNFDDIEFSKKETPEAINCLVNLVDRLDEQEAAYALCHAKTAGLFTMAALPYVRTEDWNNTALETRYIKDPGTTLGPVEHSWESSVDNTNMPVSRQIASETSFKEFDTFKDEDGDEITITSISGDGVITLDNSIFTKEEVEDFIETGYWTKIESASKENMTVEEVQNEIDNLTKGSIREVEIEVEVNNRLVEEFRDKLNDLQKERIESLENDIKLAKLDEDTKEMASKLNSLTFNIKKSKRKLQKMKYVTESGVEVRYYPEVKNYRKTMVSVEKAEKIFEKAEKAYGPQIRQVLRKISRQLIKNNGILEHYSKGLAHTPKNEEDIANRLEYYKKKLKMSQNDNFLKKSAYEQVDNMLINGHISFNNYKTLCEFVESNASTALEAVKDIKSSINKEVKARFLDDLGFSIYNMVISTISWIKDAISSLSIFDKEIKDLNEELDSIIPEGE